MIIKIIHLFEIMGILVVLNGCALFNPYIEPSAIPIKCKQENIEKECRSGETPLGKMPLLESAIVDTQDIQGNLKDKRNETKYYRVGLSLAAFGAAAGSAITGMYGASRDLILALGLGAAGSYTGASLFFSDTKIKLYNAADVGLGCVVDKAYSVTSAVNSLEKESQIIKANAGCSTNEFKNSINNLEIFEAQDATMTEKARSAGRKIIGKLNDELEKNEPSLDNILNAAMELGPLANTFAKKRDSIGTNKNLSLVTPPTPCEEQLNEFAIKIDNVINNAVEQFGAVNNCDLTLPSMTPLTASQTSINIGKDEDVMIQFSGGKEPLLLEPKWGVIPATDQIQVKRMGPREIMVSGKSNIPSTEQSFNFEVSDSAAITNRVKIVVNSKVTPKKNQ
jgi:hypothetical protein